MLCPNLAGGLLEFIPALVFSIYFGNDLQQAVGANNRIAIYFGRAFGTFTRHFSHLFGLRYG
jgi:hypothetical protein